MVITYAQRWGDNLYSTLLIICVKIYIYTYVCVHVYVYDVYIYVYMCICICICICIYVYYSRLRTCSHGHNRRGFPAWFSGNIWQRPNFSTHSPLIFRWGAVLWGPSTSICRPWSSSKSHRARWKFHIAGSHSADGGAHIALVPEWCRVKSAFLNVQLFRAKNWVPPVEFACWSSFYIFFCCPNVYPSFRHAQMSRLNASATWVLSEFDRRVT